MVTSVFGMLSCLLLTASSSIELVYLLPGITELSMGILALGGTRPPIGGEHMGGDKGPMIILLWIC